MKKVGQLSGSIFRMRLVRATIPGALLLIIPFSIWAQLSATIEGDATVCQDAASPFVTFTGTGGTAPYSFTYRIDDGGDLVAVSDGSGIAIVSVPTEVAGTFIYSLISVDDNFSELETASGSVAVTVNPLPLAIASNNGPVCEEGLLTLTGGPDGMSAYAWTGPNGFTSNEQNPAVSAIATPDMAGNYSLTVTDASNCTGSTSTNVTVNASLPVSVSISAAPSGAICSGTIVTFTALPVNGGTSPAYQWKLAGSDIPGATGSTYTTTTLANNDAITVELTSDATCETGSPATSDEITVVVNAPETPTFGQLGPYCAGSTPGVLPTTSTNSITGSWSPSTISTSSAGTSVYTFTPTAGQCATTATMTVVVNSLPVVAITGSSLICIGATTTLSPATDGIWLSNNPSVASVTSAGVVTGVATGSATFTFTSSDTNCSSTTTAVTVNATNTIALTSGEGTNNQTVCSGTAITDIIYSTTGATGATDTGLPTGVTVSWSAGTVTISGTPSVMGTFGYTVTLTGGCGATTANGTIYVNACTKSLNLTLFLEGLYNGSNGLIKVQDCDDGENSFDIFPDLISDTLTVELAQPTSPYATVFSQHGVPINTDGTLSLTSVPGGLTGNYHIVVKHRNHIETWSQVTSFAGGIVNYNFTDAISKAWGNNMVLTGGIYCIYGGDANLDQYVDGFDLASTFNFNRLGSFGYQLPDINGDGFVDGFDLASVFNNNRKGVGMNTPVAPLNKK